MAHPLHKYARHVQKELGGVSYVRCLNLIKKYWSHVQGETSERKKALLLSLIREGENPEWLLEAKRSTTD
jgi:hypothetical protein